MTEEKRQELLEAYGIGVVKLVGTVNPGMWRSEFDTHEGQYYVGDRPTRREVEDLAITLYEEIAKNA